MLNSSKPSHWTVGPVTADYTEELTSVRGCSGVSMQVDFETSAPTEADIKLQSSINGIDWTDVISTDETNTTGVVDSRMAYETVAGLPALKLRVVIDVTTIGSCTGITVDVVSI